MATIAPKNQAPQDANPVYLWETITEADDADPVEMPGYADRSVQVTGTFGGMTIALHGSNDGVNYVALNDPSGTAIAITAAGIKQIQELTRYVKPVVSGGSSADVDVTLYANKAA